MKNYKVLLILLFLAFVFVGLVGCESTTTSSENTTKASETETNPNESTTRGIITATLDTTESDVVTTEDEDDDALTVSEAIEICMQVGNVEPTNKYLVKGTVSRITNYSYGEMYISDGESELYIWGTRSADGEIYYDALDEKPHVGDTVVLLGMLHTFNDTPEMKEGWIQSFEHIDSRYAPWLHPTNARYRAR